MTFLDIFALIVLLVLIGAVVAIWVILGMLPGRIARARNHPQAAAITMCGWWGVLTMGILLPLAFIWAYTNPAVKPSSEAGSESLAEEKSNEESKP